MYLSQITFKHNIADRSIFCYKAGTHSAQLPMKLPRHQPADIWSVDYNRPEQVGGTSHRPLWCRLAPQCVASCAMHRYALVIYPTKNTREGNQLFKPIHANYTAY